MKSSVPGSSIKLEPKSTGSDPTPTDDEIVRSVLNNIVDRVCSQSHDADTSEGKLYSLRSDVLLLGWGYSNFTCVSVYLYWCHCTD